MSAKTQNATKKRITITNPNLPEYEATAYTIVGNRILFVEALTDSDCPNPCYDCDGMGHIRSLSNRHINNIDYDEAKELLENDPDVIPLSYYEHGNCIGNNILDKTDSTSLIFRHGTEEPTRSNSILRQACKLPRVPCSPSLAGWRCLPAL